MKKPTAAVQSPQSSEHFVALWHMPDGILQLGARYSRRTDVPDTHVNKHAVRLAVMKLTTMARVVA